MPLLVLMTMIQLVLCGGLVPLNGRPGLEQVSWVVPARWGFAMVASSTDLEADRDDQDPGLLRAAGVAAARDTGQPGRHPAAGGRPAGRHARCPPGTVLPPGVDQEEIDQVCASPDAAEERPAVEALGRHLVAATSRCCRARRARHRAGGVPAPPARSRSGGSAAPAGRRRAAVPALTACQLDGRERRVGDRHGEPTDRPPPRARPGAADAGAGGAADAAGPESGARPRVRRPRARADAAARAGPAPVRPEPMPQPGPGRCRRCEPGRSGQVGQRVDRHAVEADLEVQVRPGGVAGAADQPDLLALLRRPDRPRPGSSTGGRSRWRSRRRGRCRCSCRSRSPSRRRRRCRRWRRTIGVPSGAPMSWPGVEAAAAAERVDAVAEG